MSAENKPLLRWVKVKTRGLTQTPVTAFDAASFGDGTALLALLQATRPDIASAEEIAAAQCIFKQKLF